METIVKKLILLFCLSGFICSLHADIKYDKNTRTFYSLPRSSNIDQKQYNDLLKQVGYQMFQLFGAVNSVQNIYKYIIDYLTRLNTPTSLRLLKDITKDGEFFYTLLISYIDSHSDKDLEKMYQNKPELIKVFRQVCAITTTCWNSGIYGMDVYVQVEDYLKSLGTPVALELFNSIHNMAVANNEVKNK
jgi:hypothetical protein